MSVTDLTPAEQTTAFLDRFLESVPRDAGLHAYVWSLGSKRTTSWPVGEPYPDVVSAADRPSGLYYGVSLVHEELDRHERASRQTAAASLGVYLDIDLYHEMAHPHPGLPETLEDAQMILDRIGLTPTLLLHSGYGLQALWLYDTAFLLNDEADRTAAEALTTGWVTMAETLVADKGWHLDHVGDLARILRLPGTVNNKVEGDPRRATLYLWDGPRYTRDALRARIDAVLSAAPSPETPARVSGVPAGNFTIDPQAAVPARWEDLAARDPRARATFAYDRPDLVDQSPSTFDMALASRATRDGWTDQEIVDLLVAFRRENGKPPKLRPDYYARTLAKAMFTPGDTDENPEELSDAKAAIAQRGLIPALADTYEDEHFLAQDAGGVLHVYGRGVYRPLDRSLERWVRQTLEGWEATSSWKSSLAKDLTGYLRAAAPALRDHPGFKWLNVANGLIDLETGDLVPHDPGHRVTQQLPVEYDPGATCPAWDQFIAETFPEDAHHVAYELFAYVMVPDPSIQRAIMLLGSGGNGKSVYLRGLQAFLGRSNYSTETLQRLEGNRFAAVRLQGMLANIAADLPAQELAGSSVMKGVTGGDALTVEAKFRDPFDLRPFCRLVFSANLPPRTPDASEAFFSRWIVVPFDRSFRGETYEIRSQDLDARLHAPAELSGMLNKALAALPQVRDRGISEPLSLLTAKENFRRVTDPMSVWLDRFTIESPRMMVPKSILHEAYLAFAVSEDLPLIPKSTFGAALKAARPMVEAKQRQWSGRRTEVWVGIGLRDAAPLDA